jgi:hypothetical protein
MKVTARSAIGKAKSSSVGFFRFVIPKQSSPRIAIEAISWQDRPME